MKDIFLCHSKKDRDQAIKIKTELENFGYSVWFDEDDILPGQIWEQKIKNSIEEALIVMVCLSSNWVNAKSYAHKELRTALEVMYEYPEDKIFIIPIKFDDCPIPEKLKNIQYIETYKQGYLIKLQKSLESTIGIRNEEEEKKNSKF